MRLYDRPSVWLRLTLRMLIAEGIEKGAEPLRSIQAPIWLILLMPNRKVNNLFGNNIEKRQMLVRPMGSWNSTLQAAWYVRHAHCARLCYVQSVILWCLWDTSTIWLLILSSASYDVVVDTQLHKLNGGPLARVLYVFLMDDISRWLPWVPPRDNRTILQRRRCQWPFCGRILYNPHRGWGKACMILWLPILFHIKQNETKLRKKCHP